MREKNEGKEKLKLVSTNNKRITKFFFSSLVKSLISGKEEKKQKKEEIHYHMMNENVLKTCQILSVIIRSYHIEKLRERERKRKRGVRYKHSLFYLNAH